VFKYVSERADVAVGDLVVTSGLDRIYPKGLVIGRVRFVGTGDRGSSATCASSLPRASSGSRRCWSVREPPAPLEMTRSVE
jgi:hypothetical protein